MLNKIIRYYNQNRIRVWIIALVIVFAIALLQVLNHIAINNNNQEDSSTSDDAAIYQPEKSLVTGNSVSQKTYEKQSTLIDEFMKNCNEGKVENAYSLLSTDCKDTLYPSLESFTNNYYSSVFKEKRDYSLENWQGSTYRVNMTHDLLATGKSNEGVVTRDYFTIVNDNGEDKLNINNFIGTDELNKEKQDEHVQVKVIKREKYMDYEIYEIYVKNLTSNTIVLDDLVEQGTIYITDMQDINHEAYANEIASSTITINAQSSTNVRIKFANPYIGGRSIKSLTFSEPYSEYEVTDSFNTRRDVRDEFEITINL